MAKLPPFGTLMVASAWTGNALLTLLAGYLAFSHAGPLSAGTILTVAACLLSGNLLPLGVHYLHFRWESARLAAETVRADESLRTALRRLAESETRLEAAEGAISKSLLLARQIPERLQEQAHALESKLRRLDAPELIALERTFDRLNESLVEIGGRVEENTLAERDEGFNATEREQRLLTAMEALTARINALDLAPRATQPKSEVPEEPDLSEKSDLSDSAAEESTEEAEEDPDWSVALGNTAATEWESGAEFADDNDILVTESEEPAAPSPVAEDVPPAPVPVPPSKKPRKRRKEEDEDDPAFDLFPEVVKSKPAPPSADEAVLDVRAMVGIQNKLFLRGDPPFLSWDEGTPLPLTGIGEYRWTCRGLEQPLTCKLILNETDWAAGENITLVPGEVVRVTPRF